ncbi:MAG TPA: hypothetical protein VHL77_06715 [Ferruginibacter sp.]|nr:hypothetical protein [Ferruginibacter sp.]
MKDIKTTWITEKHAENILQLPASFLRRSVVSGSLKGFIKYLRTMQHKYLYNKADLENYLYENPELIGL